MSELIFYFGMIFGLAMGLIGAQFIPVFQMLFNDEFNRSDSLIPLIGVGIISLLGGIVIGVMI